MKAFVDYGRELCCQTGALFHQSERDFFHMHPHYELTFFPYPVANDTIICGKHFELDFPCALLIHPFVPHFTTMKKGEMGRRDKISFYFGKTAFQNLNLPVSLEDILGESAARISNISSICEEIKLEMELARVFCSPSQLENIFRLMWGTLTQQVLQNGNSDLKMKPNSNSYLTEVISYIGDHLDEPIDTAMLASKYYVSVDKLRKDFLKMTTVTIGSYITNMRLSHAKELLRNQIPVAEVIRRCGYDGASHFFQLFKRNFGVTPLEYSRNQKQI